MKLKNKLLLYFGILFFITINVYGAVLIESNFNTMLKNTVNGALGEYSVIYTNIKSHENTKNIFFSDKDIFKLKSEFYLKNNSNSDITVEFRNMDKEIIYSNKDTYNRLELPDSIYDINDGACNYLIYKKDKDRILAVNNYIELNDSTYYFTYISNLDSLYIDKAKSYITIIKLNLISGLFLLVFIYLISSEITRPIYCLINSMNEVIKGNYNKKFDYRSNIYEMNEISNNFSLMNNEIQSKIRELEDKNDEKERFINNLTHEIRTPLTSIIGYSDLMIKKKVDDIPLIYKAFENINREGNRILRLASNLITLITLDEKSLNLSWFSAAGMAREAANSLMIKAEEFNINIVIEEKDYEIFSDRELVMMLVTNFIDNGIKAVMNCEIRDIKIIIYDRKIIIRDTGKGIPEDELDKIFEPFYMTDKSRSKSIEGFGLGLSICREIVKLLNIGFNIESRVDIGTEITLIFEENSSI